MANLHFFGGAGTVTGSCYLIEAGGKRLLVDAGLFQGGEAAGRNQEAPAFDPKIIDAVLLTHAHIDHVGMLPYYFRCGLRCPVFATSATLDLARLILLDSAKLNQEDIQGDEHPDYNEQDVLGVLALAQAVPFDRAMALFDGILAEWTRVGHILGAGAITLQLGKKRITFSGDMGRFGAPILHDPRPIEFGDLLLIESTYGDRDHPQEQIELALAGIINLTAERGGIVLIPSFAVGRAQLILYYLRQLKERKLIDPDLPVILDSPMAQDATAIYSKHPEDYDDEALGILSRGARPFDLPMLHFIKDRNESKRLNMVEKPMVLISASGMLTGGRILHHLLHRLPSPANTLLFVGHQPAGGLGDGIKRGARHVRIRGQDTPVRAEIQELSGLSAHADQSELLRWCRQCGGKPKGVGVIHGEAPQAAGLKIALERAFGWNVFIPQQNRPVPF